MSEGGRGDPRFAPGPWLPEGTRVGAYPIPVGSGLRAVECAHCGRPLGITSWEYWNGFLVVCPHCGGYHGKPWGFERTLLAGFLINVLSFFFVMRPRRAFSAILALGAVDAILLSQSAEDDMNTAKMATALAVFALAPVAVNAVALVRHQSLLDQAPPGDPGSRGA